MLSFSPHFVKRIVCQLCPQLRRTQMVNLALGIYGQVKSQSGSMSEIVREVPGAVKHKHRLKRFFRFLSNPRIRPERLYFAWISWCINTFVKEKIITVAIDWTTLPGNIQCLMIAIPFKGRAIPLIWELVLYKNIKESQNRIEEELLTRLLNRVKGAFPERRLLVTADRGFGRATFIEFLLEKRVLFAIRVRGDVGIKTSDGRAVLLRRLGETLVPNVPVWLENIVYRSDGKVAEVNLACVVAPAKEEKEPDPWFLITNLTGANEAIARYKERFHIEEWFKDLKHQLGIGAMQTRNLLRVETMVFVSCLSYGILLVVGKVFDTSGAIKDTLITGGRKVASFIWFAIRIIKHNLVGKSFWREVIQLAIGP